MSIREKLISFDFTKDDSIINSYLKKVSILDYHREIPKNKEVRKGAVMIVLYPKKGQDYFVLTQRHDYKGVHSGQISLPGGKPELEDISLSNTAIRETQEETGIQVNSNEIIHSFAPIYIPPSNFLVSPFLSILDYTPDLLADPYEVKEIYEINILDLTTENIKVKLMDIGPEKDVPVPYYDFNGKVVWGATAGILSELHYYTDLISK